MNALEAADTHWYKNAIIYEVHVRAFHDGDGDGIGDFGGLIRKLDYLSDLGITALWVLPFYPSPLKDDGYDISDYCEINPDYGTLRDFKQLLREAHRRGIRVITELVINHTSDKHDWFKKSRRAPPGSYWRDFYVWSERPDRYRQARVIFKDFETSNWAWDPAAKAYFWHRFYSHQPDLNFDNPEVQKAIFKVVDYWLEMGVDGLRLDAIPYLFEREGTSCENLPETHEFLRRLRKHISDRFPSCMLLAEANQWPEDAVAYFGAGDECQMCFHFPLMPRLFMAIRMEDRYSIIDILKQTPEIQESCQWALFLRNHDELTLEMVTDEERDYMYNVYATDPKAAINLGIRRRLAPLVDNDRRQIELLNGLLFSLPGTPVLYYGDEIGMGDNTHLGDRNGVRTPFQWSPDRNAGFSGADPQSLYLPLISTPEYHYATVNVETAQGNQSSLLWWTKKLIAIRKSRAELGSGKLEFVESGNSKVLAYTRSHAGRVMLVAANLSRTVQYAGLLLPAMKGKRPIEQFGQVELPVIGEQPYPLTFGPYAFYWLDLADQAQGGAATAGPPDASPVRVPNGGSALEALRTGTVWRDFERWLLFYVPKARWFQHKESPVEEIALVDTVRVALDGAPSLLAVIEVTSREGPSGLYLLPVAAAEGEAAQHVLSERPQAVIARYDRAGRADAAGIYYEAVSQPALARALVIQILRERSLSGARGEIDGALVSADSRRLPVPGDGRPLSDEQSNSSCIFGKEYYFKLYRKLEAGEGPEVEIGSYLTTSGFAGSPRLIGSLRYTLGKKSYALAVLHELVETEGEGWALFLGQAANFAEQVTATAKAMPPAAELQKMASRSLGLAGILGARAAQLHLALAANAENPDFAPELFSPFYQRSLYQSLHNNAAHCLALLRKKLPVLSDEQRALANLFLEREEELHRRFAPIKLKLLDGYRIRIHGDFHLGQVVYTGKDFMIVDFEGEPKRSLRTRRLKQSPLVDVAGMLRSFDYLGEYYLKEKVLRPEDRKALSPVIAGWSGWLSAEFLRTYLETLGDTELIPKDRAAAQVLTDAFVLNKALYELTYEIGSRPAWIDIPLRGIVRALGGNLP